MAVEYFEYDDLGRMTEKLRGNDLRYTQNFQVDYNECFTYDRSGNVDEYYGGTADTCGTGVTWSHNTSNEITDVDGVDFDHNDPGEMTDRGTNCDQAFDAWGRLVEVTVDSSVIATYEYNGLGQKVKRSDSPTLQDTYYYYSAAGQVLQETATVGFWQDEIAYYIWGTQNIDDIVVRSVFGGSGWEYYVLGANNNVITRFNTSGSTASVIGHYFYDAYGNPEETTDGWWASYTIDEDLYLFTGRQYHADHAQYDFRARWMDPELGIFVTRDPIGIWGDPLAFGNGYLYAGGDPVNRRDPSGLAADREECWAEYLDDVANCRKKRSKVARAICYAAASEVYAACIASVTIRRFFRVLWSGIVHHPRVVAAWVVAGAVAVAVAFPPAAPVAAAAVGALALIPVPPDPWAIGGKFNKG